MDISIRDVHDFQVIALKGELGLYTVPNASRFVEAAIAKPGNHVALDLTELELIDSSGIAAVIHWRKQVTDGGGRFVLIGVPQSLRRMLELARLSRRLEFLESEADLEQS